MSYTNRNYRKVADRVDKTTVTALQEMLNEYDYDIGLSDVYEAMGLAVSMLLMAEKV